MDKDLRQMLLTLRKEREDFRQLRRELREQGNDWLPYLNTYGLFLVARQPARVRRAK